MRHRSVSIAAAFLALSVSALASAAFTLIGDQEFDLQVAGPAGLTIKAKSPELTGVEANGQLTLKADLTHLNTGFGMSLRDEHLRKYIAADKYPTAKLVVARNAIKLPDDNKSAAGTVQADLTLHGVTKPVSVSYTVKRTGIDYHVEGNFDIEMPDFGIEKPCYKGICTGTKVQLHATFKLRDG